MGFNRGNENNKKYQCKFRFSIQPEGQVSIPGFACSLFVPLPPATPAPTPVSHEMKVFADKAQREGSSGTSLTPLTTQIERLGIIVC